MQLTNELITHPLNYGQLVSPNSTAELKGLATEIKNRKLAAGTKIKENEKSPTYLRSFVGSVITRERYLTAKRMVGIAALHTTFHAMAQVAEKQQKAQQVMQDLMLKAEKELADAKIANLEDGIDKEKAIQEQKFRDELDRLKKQMIDEQVLTAEEQAYNDTVNKTIIERGCEACMERRY